MVKYPLKIKKLVRCQCLNADGTRCKHMAKWATSYHGEGEIYDFGVSWMVIHLCDDHYNKLRNYTVNKA